MAIYVDNGGLRLSCPSEPVSVYDWPINTFVTHKVNAEAAYTPYSLAMARSDIRAHTRVHSI